MTSPFSKLFGTSPNYDKLKIFGCLCFPWFRPYNNHKIENRSTPCVFLGYSTTQSAYLCLQQSSGRIYVSRHVQFDEQVYPFLQSSPLQSNSEPQSTRQTEPLHSLIPLRPPRVSSTLPSLGNPRIASLPPVTLEDSVDGLVDSDTQPDMTSNSNPISSEPQTQTCPIPQAHTRDTSSHSPETSNTQNNNPQAQTQNQNTNSLGPLENTVTQPSSSSSLP